MEIALTMAPDTSAAGTASPEDGLAAAFHQYYPRIVEVLDRMLGNRFEAEELAVEAFLKFDNRRMPMATYENLGGWLYRTATHLAIDFMRAAETRRRYEEMAGRETRDTASPLDQALSAERFRLARAALARLKPFQAQLLTLRGQGLSYKELAEAMNIKPAGVGTLLARAQSAFEKEYRNAEAGRQS
jgi:RNA polymerase sigma-70 factor (ECF subfamily)